MLNFTDHMKRISYLSDQVLVHVQAERFDSARDDLIKISVNANEAMQQLDELIVMQHQGSDPSKNLN